MARFPNLEFGSFCDDVLTGTDGSDIMFGFFGDDTIDAGAGNDLVFAGWGDDVVSGGAGNDRIYGGLGNDTLEGGAGWDRLNGGWGLDTAIYAGSVEDYEVTALWGRRFLVENLEDAGDVDLLRSIERLYFVADDYLVDLTGGNNAVLARDDTAAVSASGVVILSGLLDNDFDFDGDVLSITGLNTDGLVGGATLNGDGTVSYDAGEAFDGLAEGETAETSFSYEVADGQGSTDTAVVTLTVTGVNDAPELTVTGAVAVAEGDIAVTVATATDVDGDTVTFALAGADAALFTIDAGGALSFVDAPDFEAPGDADGDNVYDVTVIASDGSLTDSADVKVTVTDVVETPLLVINEFHYDDAGPDDGEFIEVAGAPDFDLTGWTLVLYNGVNGREYGTIALTGSTNALGLASVDVPGLQNGSPDGFALVAPDGSVAEFLSYEGSFTARDGAADGLTSLDVGVEEGPGTSAGLSLQRQPDNTWVAGGIATRDAPNDSGGAFDVAQDLIVNEIHYDNVGGDTGQFIEVRGEAGASLPGWTIVLYDGADGTVYDEVRLKGRLNDDGVADFDISGFQNGSPDGIVLVGPLGDVREFISYEGTFTATDGPAAGMTSTDIGVSEPNDTPIGQSLQRLDDGTWIGPVESTRGAANEATPDVAEALAVSELHYDNAGGDVGEFIEVAGEAGASLEGWSLVLYNGNGGVPYRTIDLDGTLNDAGVASVDAAGLQNGAPDGIAVVAPDGTVAEFLSYEGTITAVGGPADGMTSTDIGVAETSSTPVGQSLQKLADGTWVGPIAATRDAANGEGDTGGGGGPAEMKLISEVQGSGAASDLVGQNVAVEAVVTATLENGFFLQEEDADADADAATSEGVFVFTGGAPTVTVGDIVFAEGAVSEFFDATQITADLIEVRGMADLPTAAGLTLPFAMETDLEAVEGMLVTVTSSGEPLTIIENFNFDRFGEMVVSAGVQLQPTQIFDAQTEAAEVDALQAANAANRLTLDDGVSASNPTSFGYIANTTAGDDGDGILSVGDDFTLGNPAPRLGAEIIEPIEGVLTFSFGEYKVVPTGTLAIDAATNDGARQATPPAVEGDLKVVSFNALNYFTTLGERGAFTAEDLTRQTEKLVNALVALDGDVVGLQEIENNGFGADSAIATLVDAVNMRLGSDVYAFVDPTTDGGPIGTDEITTGLIYKTDAVTEIASDVLVFDDGDQQLNRPAVVAAFEDEDGGVVTIANNHFKSKGPSGVEAGDPNADQGDGQGNWNLARTEAATQLTDWLATDPLGVGDPDVLIIGDLNAYSQEDPVQAIEAAGYDNLLEEFVGAEDAFSFVFDGQRGALDHAMATESLDGQVKGVVEWHVNSAEPDLMSYDSRFTDAGFYDGTTPFGASDHDPLIVGLTLTPSEPDGLLG